jgi:hypothetical protein
MDEGQEGRLLLKIPGVFLIPFFFGIPGIMIIWFCLDRMMFMRFLLCHLFFEQFLLFDHLAVDFLSQSSLHSFGQFAVHPVHLFYFIATTKTKTKAKLEFKGLCSVYLSAG